MIIATSNLLIFAGYDQKHQPQHRGGLSGRRHLPRQQRYSQRRREENQTLSQSHRPEWGRRHEQPQYVATGNRRQRHQNCRRSAADQDRFVSQENGQDICSLQTQNGSYVRDS